jgi:uncharacterized protein (TIGR04255 family)
MKLPKVIDPCPIVEAIIEIRFTANVPDNAVYGSLYGALSKGFPKAETLPILEFPEAIRAASPNLKFQPHYSLSSERYKLMLGPHVFSLAITKPYVGWDAFRSIFFSTLEHIKNSQIVTTLHRLGLRYINVFPGDVLDRLNLQITLISTPVHGPATYVKSTMKDGDVNLLMQIGNDASVVVQGKVLTGTLADIDASQDDPPLPELDRLLDAAHLAEKTLFFSLLKDDFLRTLNPQY